MKEHKNHKVLGNYCWDCHRSTKPGVPGWPKLSRNDGGMTEGITAGVVWADGSEDVNRECIHCLSLTCLSPVTDIAISPTGDSYMEVENI